MTDAVAAYWQAFRATLPSDSPLHEETFAAEAFGDSPELADELGALIAAGKKTATCSALWEYETKGEPLPKVGCITIILDGRNQPLCIVETAEVVIRAFNQIDGQFAYDEGEGDRTLAYWRAAHNDFFGRTLPKIGKEMAETMPLVCERFRLLSKHKTSPRRR